MSWLLRVFKEVVEKWNDLGKGLWAISLWILAKQVLWEAIGAQQ